MEKIQMKTPLVEMDGDEMTRVKAADKISFHLFGGIEKWKKSKCPPHWSKWTATK